MVIVVIVQVSSSRRGGRGGDLHLDHRDLVQHHEAVAGQPGSHLDLVVAAAAAAIGAGATASSSSVWHVQESVVVRPAKKKTRIKLKFRETAN